MKYIVIIAAALLWTGCAYTHSAEYIPYTVDKTVTGTNSVLTTEAKVDILLDYTLNVGTTAKNIFMVFSNPLTSTASASPAFLSDTAAESSASQSQTALSLSESGAPVRIKDKPAVNSFNENPPALITDTRSAAERSTETPSYDSAGDSRSFYDDNGNVVAAHCRYVSPSPVTTENGTRILNVWVADDCWTGSSSGKPCFVTQNMVNALAQTFLNANAWNNGAPIKTALPTGTTSYDIYGLDTSIFGAEWGAHSYSNLIQPDGQITILLMDIDSDSSTDGGVLGFFYSRDCFTSYAASNQRMMFYIDAVMFANPSATSNGTSGTWDILGSYWPNEMISTLTHEFQHMIQFYQKRVTRGGSSQTWLNEMCSMAAEDFASYYLGTSGPRAVAYNDSTSGSAGNTSGRISDYLSVSDRSLFRWSSSNSDVLHSYGESYAFGSFLARSFGGATLFRNIVQNSGLGPDAVTHALAACGYDETFNTVFAKWGAAMLLSSSTAAPSGYRYNSGTWFTSTADSIAYSLGSINLFNYYDGIYTGPKLFTALPETLPAAGSQTLFYAGNLSGTQHWKLSIPAGITLSVVAK